MIRENVIKTNEIKPESLLANHSCIPTISKNDKKRYLKIWGILELKWKSKWYNTNKNEKIAVQLIKIKVIM